jgi:hypothetical protein
MKSYKISKKTTLGPRLHVIFQEPLKKPKIPLNYFIKIHPIVVVAADWVVVDFEADFVAEPVAVEVAAVPAALVSDFAAAAAAVVSVDFVSDNLLPPD